MRTAALALLLLAAAFAAGCGQDDDAPAVALRIAGPADGVVVHEDAVEVRGRVRPPDATVFVLGKRAAVSGGEFRARVPLNEGSNVIDVGASAGGAKSSWRAVRVARQSLVEVPDLTGESRDDAVDRLESLGLRAEVDEDNGLLERFLPGGRDVCETQPDAGAELPRGARVRLRVSKTC
jgi:hypothetical protein